MSADAPPAAARGRRRRLGATWALRGAAAALAGTMAGIHFDLYAAHGYSHIPTIGPLFLFNGAVGVALGLALLATPGRLLVLPALATVVLLAGTIGGLALSVNVGLFGFTETSRAPLFDPALAVEAAGIVVSLVLAAAAPLGANRGGLTRRR